MPPPIFTERSIGDFLDRSCTYATAAALNPISEGGVDTHKLWAAAGVASAACILLRPDGGILLAAVLLHVAVSAPRGAANFGERTASLKRCFDETGSAGAAA